MPVCAIQRPTMTMPPLSWLFSRSIPLQDLHERERQNKKRKEKKRNRKFQEKRRKKKTDESGPLQFLTIRRWNFKIPTNATSGLFETDPEQQDTVLHGKSLIISSFRDDTMSQRRSCTNRGFYTKQTPIKPVPVGTGKWDRVSGSRREGDETGLLYTRRASDFLDLFNPSDPICCYPKRSSALDVYRQGLPPPKNQMEREKKNQRRKKEKKNRRRPRTARCTMMVQTRQHGKRAASRVL
ncbi:hypothetical protein BDW42DRAFT_24391 [Aspergillus taichungensis]|uniref:Uncharacterized protein n=1 Tax=Aspergillus taichungensis TaxID=482145 RepID=A0A2J5I4K3_9EURO|nr:hypothetical protein BDW42DRAFT_24391 [Aspergillus taichungensis]